MSYDRKKRVGPKVGLSGFVLGIVLVLLVMGFAIHLAERGWGYVGSEGHEHEPSWFYWNEQPSPSYYAPSSSRSGSIGGSNINARGPHGGK
ncbi:MAG: hypothetical protein HQL53_12335 [Magnetococcales bacterium]|nr:hypothetical protein [Magnetococcales bacterium]